MPRYSKQRFFSDLKKYLENEGYFLLDSNNERTTNPNLTVYHVGRKHEVAEFLDEVARVSMQHGTDYLRGKVQETTLNLKIPKEEQPGSLLERAAMKLSNGLVTALGYIGEATLHVGQKTVEKQLTKAMKYDAVGMIYQNPERLSVVELDIPGSSFSPIVRSQCDAYGLRLVRSLNK